MNYLFFDIECANCFDNVGKICEFGYVLTDENLTILDCGIFLINPDAEFDWYVKHKIISYKAEEYSHAPKYPQIYNTHIKRLLELPDTVHVGHGVKNDIKYICDEAKRYSLPKPKFNSIDASIIWKQYHNESQTRNLKKLVKELGIGNPKSLHNSEYDARMTLEYIKMICKESELSFSQLIQKYSKNKKKVEQTV